MPAAEVEATFTSPVAEKEVETIPEKGETNCEGKACEETKTADKSVKNLEESEKIEIEKCPETENKEESNTLSGNEEKTASVSDAMVKKSLEDKPTQETERTTGERTTRENSKRKSTEASSQTQEEDSPPKKRKST